MRWKPFDIATDGQVDFVQGLRTLCGAGQPATRHGLAVHIYTCNVAMENKSMQNSDGDFLIGKQTSLLNWKEFKLRNVSVCFFKCQYRSKGRCESKQSSVV